MRFQFSELKVMDLSNVRIREHFGMITNDTSTAQINFLISPPKSRESIEKQDIICFDHPIYGDVCQIIAEVKEVTSYEEVAGSTTGNRVGKMLGIAQILGYVDLRNKERPLKKLLLPPNPASRIYMTYTLFLEDMFKRGKDGKSFTSPLYLGKTEIRAVSQEETDEQINFYFDADDLTSKNMLICGITGSGKTHTAMTIVEELAYKKGYPIVILDPNNEYATIGATNHDNNSDQQTDIIQISAAKNNPEEITRKIKQNQVISLTGNNLTLSEKSACYVNILSSLVKAAREKTLQPFLLVIEDAERLPTQVIQEILSTRKDIATILITSHPTILGGKVLSEIQNYIIGKTNDPADLTYLKNITNGPDDQLTSFGVGDWVVNGLNIIRPTKIHVEECSSKSGK